MRASVFLMCCARSEGVVATMERGMGLRGELTGMGMGKAESEEVHPQG